MPLIRKPTGPADTSAVPPATDEIARLSAGEAEERWAAARALAGRADATPALAAALMRESEARVREAVFTSLVRTGGAAAAAAVLPALRSDDAQLRTGALDALKAMPAEAAARLPELLADADPDVRLLAAELGRELAPGEADRLLGGLLDHEPLANVCAAAVEVLAEVGGAQVVPALERCAARFAGDPFLGFAIKAAIQRIGAQAPPARG